MGRNRTANAGVSIFAEQHQVEKKKRKASDMSIFDHVGQAQLTQQSMLPQNAAPVLHAAPNAAQVQAAWQSTIAMQGALLMGNASGAAMPHVLNAAAASAAAVPVPAPAPAPAAAPLSMAAAAGVRVPMHRNMPFNDRFSGVPMRKTRSQQQRELNAMMMAPPPAQHASPPRSMPHLTASSSGASQPRVPSAAHTAAASTYQRRTAMLAPPPLPLQASVSDIASAFGLDTRAEPLPAPAPLSGSPMRRTRSRGHATSEDSPSRLARQPSYPTLTGLPMHPTQSMINSGLDMLDSLQDLTDPSAMPPPSPGGAQYGSPMRRTRSRSLAPLPLQSSISELVSSFIADPEGTDLGE